MGTLLPFGSYNCYGLYTSYTIIELHVQAGFLATDPKSLFYCMPLRDLIMNSALQGKCAVQIWLPELHFKALQKVTMVHKQKCCHEMTLKFKSYCGRVHISAVVHSHLGYLVKLINKYREARGLSGWRARPEVKTHFPESKSSLTY